MDSVSKRQYDFVQKQPSPYTITENLPPNSIIILDYSYEISNMFFDGNEIFDLVRRDPGIGFPAWFGELVNKHTYGFDNGIKELALFQHHALMKFNSYLGTLNVPVIFIDNFFSRNVYDPASKSIATIIPLYNKSMHFKNVKASTSELELFEYSQRVIDQFYSSIRKRKDSRFKLFSPKDPNKLFSDLSHPWGYHPIHLHRICREVLLNDLVALIHEAMAEHKSKQLIIP